MKAPRTEKWGLLAVAALAMSHQHLQPTTASGSSSIPVAIGGAGGVAAKFLRKCGRSGFKDTAHSKGNGGAAALSEEERESSSAEWVTAEQGDSYSMAEQDANLEEPHHAEEEPESIFSEGRGEEKTPRAFREEMISRKAALPLREEHESGEVKRNSPGSKSQTRKGPWAKPNSPTNEEGLHTEIDTSLQACPPGKVRNVVHVTVRGMSGAFSEAGGCTFDVVTDNDDVEDWCRHFNLADVAELRRWGANSGIGGEDLTGDGKKRNLKVRTNRQAGDVPNASAEGKFEEMKQHPFRSEFSPCSGRLLRVQRALAASNLADAEVKFDRGVARNKDKETQRAIGTAHMALDAAPSGCGLEAAIKAFREKVEAAEGKKLEEKKGSGDKHGSIFPAPDEAGVATGVGSNDSVLQQKQEEVEAPAASATPNSLNPVQQETQKGFILENIVGIKTKLDLAVTRPDLRSAKFAVDRMQKLLVEAELLNNPERDAAVKQFGALLASKDYETLGEAVTKKQKDLLTEPLVSGLKASLKAIADSLKP